MCLEESIYSENRLPGVIFCSIQYSQTIFELASDQSSPTDILDFRIYTNPYPLV